jgi:hypothetical protein
MVIRWLVVALAIGAALPAGAMALDRGVILDQGPVAKEYSLPLDAQRTSLSGLSQAVRHADAVRAGIAAPESAVAPGPLFGFGILTAAQRRAAASKPGAGLASRGLVAAALPTGERRSLLSSGRLAAEVPDSGLLGGGGGIAAALVLLVGVLGGWLLRRLRLV